MFSFRFPGFYLFIFAVLLSLAFNTRADVDLANNLISRAEDNLRAVDASIGNRTSPPRGSAAKLAQSRLNAAVEDLQAAAKALQDSSAKAEGTADAKTRFDQAAALAQKLDGILTGGAGRAPAASSDASGQKLDHRQEQALKDAVFYLKEVEGLTQRLQTLAAETNQVQDKSTIDHRVISGAVNTLRDIAGRLEPIRTKLESLPPEGAGVADVSKRYNAVLQACQKLAPYFLPLHQHLQAIVDPASYPDLDTDLKRLEQLTQMYRDPTHIQGVGFDQAVQALRLAEPSKQEVMRMAQRYSDLLKQPSPLAERIEKSGNYFLQKHADYMVAASQRGKALPAEIYEHLDAVEQDAERAVANQAPSFFTQGTPQKLGWAQAKFAMLEAIDPEAARPVKQRIESLESKLQQQAVLLQKLIIDENRLPQDNYAGADREKVITAAREAWTREQPNTQILTAVIPGDRWDRVTRWEYSNGTWYFVDKSYLRVQLIIADPDDPELAIRQPVRAIKDHTKGDELTGFTDYNGGDIPAPDRILRRKNL